MSFVDRLKDSAVTLRKEAGKTLDQHGDKIAGGLEKAGSVASRATKGKYDTHISKGVGLAKDGVGKAKEELAKRNASLPPESPVDTTPPVRPVQPGDPTVDVAPATDTTPPANTVPPADVPPADVPPPVDTIPPVRPPEPEV